jgi:hypothetical protein
MLPVVQITRKFVSLLSKTRIWLIPSRNTIIVSLLINKLHQEIKTILRKGNENKGNSFILTSLFLIIYAYARCDIIDLPGHNIIHAHILHPVLDGGRSALCPGRLITETDSPIFLEERSILLPLKWIHLWFHGRPGRSLEQNRIKMGFEPLRTRLT